MVYRAPIQLSADFVIKNTFLPNAGIFSCQQNTRVAKYREPKVYELYDLTPDDDAIVEGSGQEADVEEGSGRELNDT